MANVRCSMTVVEKSVVITEELYGIQKTSLHAHMELRCVVYSRCNIFPATQRLHSMIRILILHQIEPKSKPNITNYNCIIDMSTKNLSSGCSAPDLPVEIIEQIINFIEDDFEAIRRGQLISKNFYDVLKDKLNPNLPDVQISNAARNFFQKRHPLKATTDMIRTRYGEGIGAVELQLNMLGPRSGKTSFLRSLGVRLHSGIAPIYLPPTVDIDYTHLPEININGTDTEISLWDSRETDLHETCMKTKYLFGSVGVWLCFSIANRMSFRSLLEQWLDEIIKCEVMSYTKFYLVGMCADLEHQRQVSREEAERVAHRLGMTYIECSSTDAQAYPVDWRSISFDLLQARCHEPYYDDEYPEVVPPPARRWCLLL